MFFTKEFHIVPNHYTVVSKIQANECTILMTIFIVHLLMDKQLNVLTPMNFFPSDHVHVHSLATHLYYYYKYINISIVSIIIPSLCKQISNLENIIILIPNFYWSKQKWSLFLLN